MPWAEALIRAKAAENSTDTPGEGRIITYTQALQEALILALELDPNVFVMGQGLDDPSGMFGVTKGLQERFGKKRAFDTPLSEDALTGLAVGAAMNGLRPVYMHNRPDFLLLTFNQLVNHASKTSYMDVGTTTMPLVIWAAIGRGWGSGAQHSQAIQGLLMTVPGLKIIMPSTPYDAKGLLLAAIADNSPTLIFEHRWLMKQKAMVPEGLYHVPIGKGIYRRRGADITIVGSSQILMLAMEAANQLEQECGLTAEVVDLRTVKPIDEEIVFESVEKTGRLLVVDTGWEMGGVCAEVCCLVAEKRFQALKGAVGRIGLPPCPHPAGYTLEQYFYPDVARIKEKILALVKS